MKIPKGFTDGMPSHEFGHLLGLEDEYNEEVDLPHARIEYTTDRGNMMGAYGPVLPRHLALAVRLLRQHRLVVPQNP